MKRFFAVMAAILLLSVPAYAKIIINEGLVLQDGASKITLYPGQKTALHAKDSFWNTPRYKNMRYASANPSVAWVDKRGILHGSLPGQTVIYVSESDGNSGTINVIVTGKRKIPRISWMILFTLFMSVLMGYAIFCGG